MQLGLRAVALSRIASEPDAGVLTLEMGEPGKILDLANNLIEMAGLKPGIDIEIVFIGSRPGEKLVEEVVYSAGRLRSTQWNKILLDKPDRIDFDHFQQKLEELGVFAATGESIRLVELLKEMVPTYAGGGVERC